MEKLMGTKSIRFAGNGNKYFARGTFGLTTKALKEFLKCEEQTSWMDDAFGAPDVAALVVVMNCSLVFLLAVVPAVQWLVREGETLAHTVKYSSLGLGVGLLLVYKHFHLANFWLGAPQKLVEAAEGFLWKWSLSPEALRLADPAAAVATTRAFLNKKSLDGLGRVIVGMEPLRTVHDAVGRLNTLPNLETTWVDRPGLLLRIFKDVDECLSLTESQLNALVSLAPVGVIIAMADPEYQELEAPLGFNRQFLLKAIHLHKDDGSSSDLYVEEDGSWYKDLSHGEGFTSPSGSAPQPAAETKPCFWRCCSGCRCWLWLCRCCSGHGGTEHDRTGDLETQPQGRRYHNDYGAVTLQELSRRLDEEAANSEPRGTMLTTDELRARWNNLSTEAPIATELVAMQGPVNQPPQAADAMEFDIVQDPMASQPLEEEI